MTRDEIKQLALKSGFPLRYQPGSNDLKPYVYDFAQKIESATSERMRMDGWRQCAKGQHTSHFCGQFEEAVAKAVLAEREACAHVCDANPDRMGYVLADLIRTRRDE